MFCDCDRSLSPSHDGSLWKSNLLDMTATNANPEDFSSHWFTDSTDPLLGKGKCPPCALERSLGKHVTAGMAEIADSLLVWPVGHPSPSLWDQPCHEPGTAIRHGQSDKPVRSPDSSCSFAVQLGSKATRFTLTRFAFYNGARSLVYCLKWHAA